MLSIFIKSDSELSALHFPYTAAHFPPLASCFPRLAAHFLPLASCFPCLAAHFPRLASCFPCLAAHFPRLASCFPRLAAHFPHLASCFPCLAAHFPHLASCLPEAAEPGANSLLPFLQTALTGKTDINFAKSSWHCNLVLTLNDSLPACRLITLRSDCIFLPFFVCAYRPKGLCQMAYIKKPGSLTHWPDKPESLIKSRINCG